MTKRLVILLTLVGIATQADTAQERYGYGLAKPASQARPRSAAPVAAEYRIVTNHVFNVPFSIYWQPFKGECQRFLTNGIVLQEVKINRVYQVAPVSYEQSIGAYGSPPARTLISETRIPGKKFFLRNCPAALQPTTGKEISGKAMQDGTIQIGRDILEVWDYGIPCRPKP